MLAEAQGGLTPQEARGVMTHIFYCPRCRCVFKQFVYVDRVWALAARPGRDWGSVKDRFWAMVDEEERNSSLHLIGPQDVT
jgi:anti-sigma factor ChrR (cupin superfamily)